jgi:putative acetyltransferase
MSLLSLKTINASLPAFLTSLIILNEPPRFMTMYIRTHANNLDFQDLSALLDDDLKIRDGDDHAFYAQFNKIENIQNAVVCYVDNIPVGCGAFKKYGENEVEIKRMFVLPQYRGQGIGLRILNELEKWAAELNYSKCILETGKMQPEAISLYQKAGYTIIQNYGQYENVENSVCMAKQLV